MYECYAAKSVNSSQISLEDDGTIPGPLLPAAFPKAKELVTILRTIGPKLERRVTDGSRNHVALQEMSPDGIGSAAVGKLVPEALRVIAIEASSPGHEVSGPVSPDMPCFPLTEQRNLPL